MRQHIGYVRKWTTCSLNVRPHPCGRPMGLLGRPLRYVGRRGRLAQSGGAAGRVSLEGADLSCAFFGGPNCFWIRITVSKVWKFVALGIRTAFELGQMFIIFCVFDLRSEISNYIMASPVDTDVAI